MIKQCPQHQILNPVTNRCVNKDGNIGRKLIMESIKNNATLQLKSPDCPPGKIRNPATNRCVNIDGPIGRKLASSSIAQTMVNTPPVINTEVILPNTLFNKWITDQKCTKKLNNKIHQCNCPICWIVSSIVAIKFSNIHKYLDTDYKKIVKDAYNIFSDFNKDYNKCPYIPTKVINRYIKTLKERKLPLIDRNVVLSEAGIPSIFIYSLLYVGLMNPYKTVLTVNLYKFYNKNTIAIDSIYLRPNISLSSNNYMDVLNMLNYHKNRFLSIGYKFNSGILVTAIKKGDGHSVAFTECNGKYYICHSHNVECIEIKNNAKYEKYIAPLKNILTVVFILIPI